MKVKLSANILFSGIGCQERGLENTGLFDLEVKTTSEINKEAILSYAAIHNGLTPELVEEYTDYPTVDEMIQELTDKNIGYKPEENKPYNWEKHRKNGQDVIKKYWLAVKLSNNLGDISRIKGLPYADLWTISFPCFVEGTLVFTSNGYKPIEEIESGDIVLTHKNQWQKVIMPMTNFANKLYKIDTMNSESIFCTPNHPFFVRERYREWNNKRRRYERHFKDAIWVDAKDLTKDYYVGTSINTIEELPKWDGVILKTPQKKEYISNKLSEKFNTDEFWYIIGRYIGDGWIRHQGGIIICGNERDIPKITQKLDYLGFNYSINHDKTVDKIHIPFKEIGEYCLRFGRGASNKHLTKDILNLPTQYLKSFLCGYIDADGTEKGNGYIGITSVGKTLIYETVQCINKAYHRPCSVYLSKRPKEYTIQGRTVNQKDCYTIMFKLESDKQDQAFYEDGYIWTPIKKVEEQEYNGLVYNLEVENDNSYMIQNIIVHNCQSISCAGKMKGFKPDSGTRSSLLWENIRLLKLAKDNGKEPKYLMFENVKNLVSKKFIDDFNSLLDVLNDLGYNSYWKVLNAKECGIPQNRERVFVICIRKDIDTNKFTFPIPFDNGVRLKDVLESDVDEKYYINNDKAKTLIEKLIMDNVIPDPDDEDPIGIDLTIKNPRKKKVCSNCITSRQRGISNRAQEGTGVVKAMDKGESNEQE